MPLGFTPEIQLESWMIQLDTSPFTFLRFENQGGEEQCMIQEFGVVDSPVQANTERLTGATLFSEGFA